MMEAKRSEIMVLSAARAIENFDVVFVGIGLPNLAVNLARLTHAPEVQLVYEAGVYGAKPARLPISIGDPSLVTGSVQVMPMKDTFEYFLQGGRIDVGFLGAAQIDRFGNLNSTFIGHDYENPDVRLPGAGGATEIAWLAKETVVLLPQKRNKFPARLDFRTSIGFGDGAGSRETLGAAGGGPAKVISDLGIYGFDPTTREMVLEAVHPGVRVEEVKSEVSWELRVKEPVKTTEMPTDDVLRLIRNELDPKGIYLG